MTPDKAQKFRALVNVLVSQGFNPWDARIEARRLLDIKFESRKRERKTRFIKDADRNRPEWIPTVEDRLDVYFRSIVSTCRSVVFGTAVFRSFSEFSQSWNDKVPAPRNRGRYSPESKEFREISKPRYYKPVMKRPKGYWQMVRILEAGGLTYENARVQAQILLTGGENAESHNVTEGIRSV